MKAENKEDIKAHLDRALKMKNFLICILIEGLTETTHLYSHNAEIYYKIEFLPLFYCDGYYSGHMFFPNAKSQGLMDFHVDSFASVVCLEEA